MARGMRRKPQREAEAKERSKRACQSPLTERVVRPSGLERRTVNPNSTGYEQELAVARATLVEVGPNEFRTPSRRELKRPGGQDVGVAVLRKIRMSKYRRGEMPMLGRKPKPYTRKQKGLRKTILERNAIVTAQFEQIRVCHLVWRARGFVGSDPCPI